jgi:hypothetical protein
LSITIWVAAALAPFLLAGCGGSGGSSGSSEESRGGGAASDGGGATAGGGAGAPPQLGPPEANESIDEAAKRIEATLKTGDCDQIAKLNPLGRPTLDNPKRCAALKRLTKLDSTGAAAYGGGGIIDYAIGKRTLAVLLIVDSDRLYHIALLDPFVGRSSIGTAFAPQFDAAAHKTAKALADHDCKAFLAVASQQIGIGTLGAKKVCPLPRTNPFSAISENVPSAQPQRLGGNADFAFYGYGTPGVNYTMLMARESNEGLPPTLPRIPNDATEYSYLGVYRTNSKAPAG